MSGPENLNGAVADPFQARFGVPAGTQSPEVERHLWEQFCLELLRERDQLGVELAVMRAERNAALDLYSNKVAEGFTLTKEEVLAQLDQETTLFQVIADLGRERSSEVAGSHA